MPLWCAVGAFANGMLLEKHPEILPILAQNSVDGFVNARFEGVIRDSELPKLWKHLFLEHASHLMLQAFLVREACNRKPHYCLQKMPEHQHTRGQVNVCNICHAFGTPEMVIQRRRYLRDKLGLRGSSRSWHAKDIGGQTFGQVVLVLLAVTVLLPILRLRRPTGARAPRVIRLGVAGL